MVWQRTIINSIPRCSTGWLPSPLARAERHSKDKNNPTRRRNQCLSMTPSPANVDEVHKLAVAHVTPFVCWGGEARVDRGLIKLLSRLGLVAPFFSAEFGGTGDGRVSATLLCNYREGLARVSPEASTALATQIGGIFVAARHGSEAIRREWIPRVVTGEAVTAIALTEPDCGSDAASMAMPARRVAGGWRFQR